METAMSSALKADGKELSLLTPKQSSSIPEASKTDRGKHIWHVLIVLAVASVLSCCSLWLLSRVDLTYLRSVAVEASLPADLYSLTTRGKSGLEGVPHSKKSGESNSKKQEGIPKFIHQTFKSSEIPSELTSAVQSWKEQNPEWEYRLYNDADCLNFVKAEFPEYLDAYQSLPKNVERSDFFRYLIVLRYGGIYADIDTECKVPMDRVLQPEDGLVVGWECDVPSKDIAIKRHFVRQRQVLQWVFAAVPGHPVLQEVCASIAKHAKAEFPDLSSNHNTLEKTGPGIWTDTVLRHTLKSNHSIRILPQVAFGVHPSGTDELNPESSGIRVQHYFSGSWKSGSWGDRNLLMLKFFRNDTKEVIKPPVVPYFPVSADFTPPFTIYVHPSGSGPMVGSSDVGAELTRRGSWQAGHPLPQNPRVVDVVAGSLGNVRMDLHLVDIGAGLGFFSLAAACRHHPVIAFETEAVSLGPFRRSILANDVQDSIVLLTSVEAFTHAMHPPCTTPNAASFLKLEKNFSQVQNKSQVDCQMEVGVLRVGHSGWVFWQALNGGQYLHQFEPEIVVLEFSPWIMKRAGIDRPMIILEALVDLDYKEIYHSGRLCNRRWQILSKHIPELSAEEKPAWCHVSPNDLSIFNRMEQSEREQPENILLVKRRSEVVQ